MKKIISIVLSAVLAVGASMSAMAYTDVSTETANAQAIQELTDLKVIEGYTNNEFKPEGLVTRAEITKMIVAALNEEATSTTTNFVDSQNHWAINYIEQGVIDGFINGYNDIEFGPDDNVTYVQAQKMLVAALGYGSYAENAGGWPNGYKQYASNIGINDGVTAKDNDKLTRAQVAQMIDNALNIPVCVISGYENTAFGTATPKFEIKDGQGKDYQTVLTKKFNAYKVYGRVIGTYKSTTGSTLEADQVEFRVEKADNFNDEYIKSTDAITETMYVGNSKADEYLNTYAQAIVQKDENDEYTILSINPIAGNQKSVVVKAKDINNSKTDLDNNKIYFYNENNRSSTKYELADEVSFYVNEVYIGNFTSAEYEKYIYDVTNDEGYSATTVELQKENNIGSTLSASKYSIIKVTTYETFVVDEVIDKSSQTNITFKEQSVNGSLKIYKDDSSYNYTITLNGKAIDANDIKEDDVLSVSYDYNGSFNESKFYDIIVSRDVVNNAKCTSINTNDKNYTIDGKDYTVARGIDINIEVGTTYALYLDAFGNIARIEEETNSKKIGILKNVYKEANGDYVAQVIGKNGTETSYSVDDKDYENYISILQEGSKLETYPQQVIEYSVRSNNRINIKDVIAAGAQAENAVYKEASSRVGAVRLSSSSVIIDLSDIDTKDTYRVTNINSLIDNSEYTIYGYDKASDGTYRYAILTDGIGGVNSTTQLAIFDGYEIVDVNGDMRTQYNVLINNAKHSYIVDEDVDIITGEDETAFKEGDAIVFSKNATGEISQVYNVFTSAGIADSEKYDTFRDKIIANQILTTPDLAATLSDNNDTVDLYFGPVVNKNNSTITIGTIVDGTVNYDTGVEVDTNKATIYTYDFNGGKNKLVLNNGLQVTPDIKSAKTVINGEEILNITDENVYDNIVFGLVRTINGDEAKEIYLFVNEN